MLIVDLSKSTYQKLCLSIVFVLLCIPSALGIGIKFAKQSSEHSLSGSYSDFLKTRFGTNKKIFFDGSSIGFLFPIVQKDFFLFEIIELEAKLPYKTLDNEQKSNELELSQYNFIYKKRAFDYEYIDIFVSVGIGIEILTRRMHGFSDDNVLSSNVDTIAIKKENRSNSQFFTFGGSICLCIEQIEIGAGLVYYQAQHFISNSQSRAALSNKNTAIDSNLNMTALINSIYFIYHF